MASSTAAKRQRSNFSFVSISHPDDAMDQAVRRRIRSHVSTVQHRENRKRMKHATSGGNPGAPPPAPTTSSEGQGAVRTQTNDDTGQSRSTHKHLHLQNAVPASYHNVANRPPVSSLDMSFSRGGPSFRSFALFDSDNIVGMSIGALGFDVAEIMSFYKMVVQVEARDFEQYYPEMTQKPEVPTWKKFWNFVPTEPVLIIIAILAIAHYKIDTLRRTSPARDLFHTQRIETFLLGAINHALSDPIRGISDQMLIAVILIAAYEIKHRNAANYHVHTRGLVEMINLRGGLARIAKSDPYVEQLLLFQDAKTAILAGNEGYLKFMPNSMQQYPANPPDYMQAVGARVQSQATNAARKVLASENTALVGV